jgi:arginyl-tRNA synthetase
MIFNPEESIDFHGFTGPFIQYTHARIKSILRKVAGESGKGTTVSPVAPATMALHSLEKEVIVALEKFPSVIEEAGDELNPSKVAIYIFNLAQSFNSFLSEHSIANAESEEKKQLRLQLAVLTAHVIKTGMGLLGIRVPERM